MGWIGNILCVIGLWQIGRKKRVGFLWTIASCVFWIIEGYNLGSLGLIFIETALGILSFHNWRKWKHEENRASDTRGI